MKEGMKDLDDELGNALGREEAPAGFAERVLEGVARQSWRPPLGGPIRLKPDPTYQNVHMSFVRWAAAAAVVGTLAGAWLQYRDVQRERAERAEGEAARECVVLALHIAGTKLQLVQTKIQQLHEQ